MTFREFTRFHLLKVLLILVVVQIAGVAFIQNYNHRPVAQRDQASIIEGRPAKIIPLSNDSDKDEDDEIVIENASSPIHGKVEQKGNFIFYVPEKDFVGIDSFSYTITDGRKKSVSYIAIQVNENLKPVANRDIAETYSGSAIIIDVLKNDMDHEGDSIRLSGFSQPVNGGVSLIENQLVYKSNASFVQIDSFFYFISDGKSISDSVSVTINIQSKSNPCYPWLSSDVGDAAIPGSFTNINKTFVVEGSGSDIWNSYDGFRYVYQYVNGDCEIYTKVESLEGTHEWAKAGVMVRESLGGGSKIAFVCISNKNGATHHQRFAVNEQMEGGNNIPEIKAPFWIKLTRKGDTFTYYISPDGSKWKSIGEKNVPMGENVYIGFAVTSHNNGEKGKAVFSNYRMTGKAAKI